MKMAQMEEEMKENEIIPMEADGLSEQEIEELAEAEKRFIRAYAEREPEDTEGKWLAVQLKKELPEKTEEEIETMAGEILDSVGAFDSNLQELNAACSSGISKESWFAKKMSEAAEGMSMVDYGNYLNGIDNALNIANDQMMRTVTTNAGEISRCMNLDGFIAEQRAVNTFNMQAQLQGSKYFAEVKVPGPGETYGQNSFDTVIRDSTTGKTVHQYQFKFGKDAKTTIKLLRDGNYNNQRFVVPAEQVEEVRKAFPGKSVEAHIGGTETVPVQSEALTKEQAKHLQGDIQDNGVLPRMDWNVYNTKELALNIGKNAGLAGLEAAALSTGFIMAGKAVMGEKIEAEEVVETALVTGADAGVKAAASGAVKVCAEKGIIRMIPKGTPGDVITTVVCVGIENVKIMAKVVREDLPLEEAMELMGRNTVAMIYGLSWAAAGATVGGAALSWFPVVGPVVGGIVGGIIGYLAGSKFGQYVYDGAKKIGRVVKNTAQKVWSGIKSAGSRVVNSVKSVVGGIKSVFGR